MSSKYQLWKVEDADSIIYFRKGHGQTFESQKNITGFGGQNRSVRLAALQN